MTEAETTALLEALTTFDRRLSAIDGRFVTVEGYLADGATAGEETSKSVGKLTELYLSIDTRLGSIEALLSNYVEETAKLRRTSQQLISEVREKLKVASG